MGKKLSGAALAFGGLSTAANVAFIATADDDTDTSTAKSAIPVMGTVAVLGAITYPREGQKKRGKKRRKKGRK